MKLAWGLASALGPASAKATAGGDNALHQRLDGREAGGQAFGMYTIIGGDGREYGPVSAEQIRGWIAGGRANGQTRAKLFGTDEWKTLEEFSDFAPRAAEPPPLGGEAVVGAGGVFGGAPLSVSGPALASRGRRFGGFVIDNVLVSLCFIPLMIAVPLTVLSTALQERDASALTALPGVLTGVAISGFLAFALFLAQVTLLTMRGQSIGKMLMKTRIVRAENGLPAGFVGAFLVRSFVMTLFTSMPYIGGLVWITDACFIFRDDRRCLHDLLARTKVIAVS